MIIYTDGSARPTNPGPGGFGVVVLNDDEVVLEMYQHHDDWTTNNEQEIKAILYALIKYGKNDNVPLVLTDSKYCYNIFTDWIKKWKYNNWCKADGSPILNKELIMAFDDLTQQGYRIDLRWVKGHSVNKWNNLADKLATYEIKLQGD